jgi:hypothetical protein
LASIAFSKLIHAFAVVILLANSAEVKNPFNARITIDRTIDGNEIIVTADAFMKLNRFHVLELA